MKKLVKLQDVKFAHKEFSDVNVSDCLIYCDPPYVGTTGYGAVGEFNTERFWQHCRYLSSNNTVVVSEYVAPDDFVCVWQKKTKTDMHTLSGKEPRIEKLFMHESQAANVNP